MNVRQSWFPALIPPIACLPFVWILFETGAAMTARVSLEGGISAIGLYLAAHVLRAIRLSIMGTRILSLRARTLMLLHFNAAPVSTLIPLKLGELYRWQQLAALEKDLVRPFLLLVIDRSLDAVTLLCLVCGLLVTGASPAMHRLGAVVLVALGAALVIFLLLRPMLRSIQTYIFDTHFSARTLHVLQVIDPLRRSIELAADCVSGNMALLLTLSGAIWFCEASALANLMAVSVPHALSYLVSTLSVVTAPATRLAAPATEAATLYTLLATVTLVGAWPFATYLYIARLNRHHLWPTTTRKRDVRPGPLSASVNRRALRLHVPRRSL